jgi:TP901 family phage tail tape measure protein
MAEVARAQIYLDGKQAESALEALKKKSSELRKELIKAQESGDKVSMNKLGKELQSVEAAQKSLRRSTFEYKKVLDNLSGASINDLTRALRTVQSQMKNMDRSDPAFKKMTEDAKRLKAEISRVNSSMQTQQTGLQRLIKTAKGLLPAFGLAGIIAVFRRALQVSIEFEKSQSNLAAVLGKTRKEIKDLTDDAKKYGSVTKFTASEVSGLQTEFAKLGLTTEQIKSSTRAALNLAAATGGDLAAAAKVTGVALKAFELSAENADRVASAMAVSTSRSALSFEDLETILSTVGPVAKAYGLQLEDVLALSGKLKDAGFDASSAATATRNILLNLADGSGKLATALGQPVKTLDQLIPALVNLRSKGVDLNQTLELTDKRSVAAFNTFLSAGASTIELRDGLIGVNDELQKMVDTQLDNVAGDITILNSAWQGFILSIEQGDGVIAKFTRFTLKFFTDSLIKLSNIDLIFKRASKFTEGEVTRAYDAMMNLSGKKYKKFQEIVRSEDKFTIDQVIMRREAMIREIRDTGQSHTEAVKLWDEYYRRRKEQSMQAIRLRNEEARKEAEASKAAVGGTGADEKALKIAAKAREKLMKFLNETDEKMRFEIERYFRNAGEGAMEAFFDAIDKKKNEYSDIFKNFKLSPEKTIDVDIDYALQKYAETEQGKLNSLSARLAAGKISEQQYQDEVTQIAREAEEKRLKTKMSKAEDAQKLANLSANLIYSLMDLELEKAGENEEKKKEIRKKYANIQFLVTASQIVTDTAAAIMKSLAELGPIAGSIAAAIIGATGAVQLGIANAERSKMQGYSEGGFTGTGERDEPAGVVHKGEWVAPAWQVKDPATGAIIKMLENNRRSQTRINTDILRSIPRGYQSGGLVSSNSIMGQGLSGSILSVSGVDNLSIQRQNEVLEKISISIDQLLKWKPKVYTELIKKDLDTLESIDKNRGL